MRRSLVVRDLALIVAIVSGVAFSAASCGGGGNGGLGAGKGDASSGDDAGGASEGGFVFDTGNRSIVSIAISPAASTLTVTDPKSPPSTTLSAVATYDDGSTGPVPAAWTLDRYDLASIGASTGTVTASGTAGGVVNVTATVNGKTASTTVTVNLQLTVSLAGAPSASVASLLGAATDPDPQVAKFLYPYDQTVFPKGLAGPEVMWNGGSAGDAYLLRLKGAYVSIDVLGTADPPSVVSIDDATWNALTSSVTSGGSEGAVSVELRRSPAASGAAYVSAKASWRIANANVRGTIYYWAVNQGQIVKITPGATTPAPAIVDIGAATSLGPVTPVGGATDATNPPWQANDSGNTCVACHAVSKDGSRLSSVWSTPRGSTGPAGFVDLATGKTGAIANYDQNATFMSLTPDGKKALVNTNDNHFRLLDAATAAPLVGTDGDVGWVNVDDPSFSNDGSKLAFAGNANTLYPVEFCNSDLQVATFDPTTNALGAPQTIVAFDRSKDLGSTCGGYPRSGDAIAFPSWSPDSNWIFYQRGEYSRAKYGACAAPDHSDCYFGKNDLYAAAATPGASQIRLAAANGDGVLDADNAHLNYQPTVNPIAEGGYFWVVFVSVRDYGNKMVSARGSTPITNATYTNRKQLWVAAVDASMKAVDPSHPAFRLPGQLLTTVNMNGYWTLSPCKPTPTDGSVASCSAGFECCSGFCRDTDGKGPRCVDAPSGCSATGDKCTTAADCCASGSACVGGFCSTSPK
jgi:Tol biopolymer transport system component